MGVDGESGGTVIPGETAGPSETAGPGGTAGMTWRGPLLCALAAILWSTA
ncbi:MAG: hypothetical protein RL069_2520, partial [Planctomycetota bacterium]